MSRSKRTVATRIGTTYILVTCTASCDGLYIGFTDDDLVVARKIARRHAAETGHSTWVEQTIATAYDKAADEERDEAP